MKGLHKVKNGEDFETKLFNVTSEEQYVTSEEHLVTSEEFHWCQTIPEAIFQEPFF